MDFFEFILFRTLCVSGSRFLFPFSDLEFLNYYFIKYNIVCLPPFSSPLLLRLLWYECQYAWCCLRGLLSYYHYKKDFFFLFSLGEFHFSFSLWSTSLHHLSILQLIPSTVFSTSVIIFFSSLWFFFMFSNSLLKFLLCLSILLEFVETLYNHYLELFIR